MYSVTRETIEQSLSIIEILYIGGPTVPTQDGQGLVAVGGALGSGGGERDEMDEVPVACGIRAGGM
jgi:hypothetical protein